MTLKKALGTIVLTTMVFTVFGAGIGILLGQLMPGYYRSVFSGGDRPEFDPRQTGFGLGMTQGLAGGIVVGLITVALMIWNDKSSSAATTDKEDIPAEKSRGGLRTILALALTVIFVVSVAGSFIAGSVRAEQDHFRRQINLQLQRLKPILNDEQYTHVQTTIGANGRVALEGTVDNPPARAELLDRLQHLFGDEDAASMLEGVTVRD